MLEIKLTKIPFHYYYPHGNSCQTSDTRLKYATTCHLMPYALTNFKEQFLKTYHKIKKGPSSELFGPWFNDVM